MTKYELMLILKSDISQVERDETIDNLKKLLEKNSAKIQKEDIWWEKVLAYKIKSSNRWFYCLYNIEIDGKLITSITKDINLFKNIIRFMFVKLD